MTRHPNLVYVFADQWRAQATGFAGDPNVSTPHLDRLAAQSVVMTTHVANTPVCCPARATLLTGRYAHTHRVIVNDVHLSHDAVSFADALNAAGYHTGYIGKWHVNADGRSSFIEPKDRQGFSFWRTRECSHDYHNDWYHDEDGVTRIPWEGYDAFAQTHQACQYIEERAADRSQPFALFLSWGPPHDPYDTAPPEYRGRYNAADVKLRPNVPADQHDKARRDLAGYYAHCTALDDALAQLLAKLDELGIADDTVFVFTSDHGDMHGSQGYYNKQQPWDESILVPFVLRYPRKLGRQQRCLDAPFGTVDLMPTLLSLCGVETPATVEGLDFSRYITGQAPAPTDAQLITCYHPFAYWWCREAGGREYRGVRTARYTYTRAIDGPWLLYDNHADPYQMRNLVDDPASRAVRDELDERLTRLLRDIGDDFAPADEWLCRFGYTVGSHGAVPYTP